MVSPVNPSFQRSGLRGRAAAEGRCSGVVMFALAALGTARASYPFIKATGWFNETDVNKVACCVPFVLISLIIAFKMVAYGLRPSPVQVDSGKVDEAYKRSDSVEEKFGGLPPLDGRPYRRQIDGGLPPLQRYD